MYTPIKTMDKTETVALNDIANTAIKIKVPKRVLHFSDGILEEYSDDEIDSSMVKEQITVVDPGTMSWIPWISYKTWTAGSTVLAACDYVGESLASFFGITTPKYWHEIEESKRVQEETEERQKKAQGWSEPALTVEETSDSIKTNQPTSSTSL